jgi:hypothetical protein
MSGARAIYLGILCCCLAVVAVLLRAHIMGDFFAVVAGVAF